MKKTDIEIYLKDSNLTKVTSWLNDLLGECTPWQQTNKVSKCKTLQQEITITWYEKAVGSWHCLYLEGKNLPWADDLECALEANKKLNIEIRCAPNAWSETKVDDEENSWLNIVNQTTSTITWNV